MNIDNVNNLETNTKFHIVSDKKEVHLLRDAIRFCYTFNLHSFGKMQHTRIKRNLNLTDVCRIIIFVRFEP